MLSEVEASLPRKYSRQASDSAHLIPSRIPLQPEPGDWCGAFFYVRSMPQLNQKENNLVSKRQQVNNRVGVKLFYSGVARKVTVLFLNQCQHQIADIPIALLPAHRSAEPTQTNYSSISNYQSSKFLTASINYLQR